MNAHLYLSLIPESLVASMLPPREFGAYLATGTQKRPHGQAMFFQVKQDFQSDFFDLASVDERCVPHPNGEPKHSVYLAVYRVLEHVPLSALGNLCLASAHGQVLEIEPAGAPSEAAGKYHLYQELCPVHPMIASSLDPAGFSRLITDPARPIQVPRICFVELDLADLADDPAGGAAAGLPYPGVEHLRSCLCELRPIGGKESKTVDRIGRRSLIYRSVKTGFYVGDREGMLCYPYPTREELESKYYQWWRCVNDAELWHDAVGV
ncbi:MAG: hypothetical protein WBF17_21485 [Phycisphaerae bacterium]